MDVVQYTYDRTRYGHLTVELRVAEKTDRIEVRQ